MTDDSANANNPRRRFLATVAGGTAALAAAGFSARELLAQRSTPAYPAPQGGWDFSWVDKVERAKHRFLYDSADISDGTGLSNAYNVLRGYDEVYKSAEPEVASVLVFRSSGVPVVLNDDMWNRLKVGERTKLKDPTTGEVTLRNPFIKLKADDKNMPVAIEASLDTMIARGAIVLACNLALMRQAGTLARNENMPVEEARTAIINAVLPGVIRMPSGVFAVMRAQEAGCHFLKSA